MLNTRELLRQVGSLPLDARLEDIKELADVVWYQGYFPTKTDLELLRPRLSREGFQRLLCVLELLSQYPVCPREGARHLQELTLYFHRLLLGGGGPLGQGRYSPSKRWQINDQTSALRKALLPIQTRTYADSTGKRHGLSA
ncbi:hypothetical protein SAMN04488490_0068 [Marinobacter sp. LV10R510-11A]|jgi:hypothetical protein|nr:hypothetical protein SAMN04488490_0068 [Marinobacter sp. LV10R510-11A]